MCGMVWAALYPQAAAEDAPSQPGLVSVWGAAAAGDDPALLLLASPDGDYFWGGAPSAGAAVRALSLSAAVTGRSEG